jgi:hypothetical protein
MNLDVTMWAFLLFFLPGLLLWVLAALHDLVQVAVRRWRA